jgi:hypothetical protein
MALSEYVETQYMPWVQSNKAAPATATQLLTNLEYVLGPRHGKTALVDLNTHQVTEALDSFAQRKFGTRTLSHIILNG